jgi:hypothetical protein
MVPPDIHMKFSQYLSHERASLLRSTDCTWLNMLQLAAGMRRSSTLQRAWQAQFTSNLSAT